MRKSSRNRQIENSADMDKHSANVLNTTTNTGSFEYLARPFVVELSEGLTVGSLMEILSKVHPGTKILCDFNVLDSKSFPMTCLRYDGKRLIEITIGD